MLRNKIIVSEFSQLQVGLRKKRYIHLERKKFEKCPKPQKACENSKRSNFGPANLPRSFRYSTILWKYNFRPNFGSLILTVNFSIEFRFEIFDDNF